jgi:radical SAM protein with 4Fe4S-binding SPASM domain
MEWGLFQRIVDEARDFVYDANLHHTGESLIHPELPGMVRYARERGIYTRLHTNATLLTEEKSRELIEAGLDLISFSFDGYDRQTYEGIRVGAQFEPTLENIRNFLRIKGRLGSRRPFTIFEVIDFSQGQEEKRTALERELLSLGLNRFLVKQPHNWGGDYALDARDRSPIEGGSSYTPCTFPWYALVVFAGGEVMPCPQDFFGELQVGDLNVSSLREVWNGPEMISLRARMGAKKVQDLVPCATCDMLSRKTLLGIPTPNLSTFLKESLLGYGGKKKL